MNDSSRAHPGRDAAAGRLRGAVRRILALQEADGAIPWFEDGPWDPWNHVECAMALDLMGERAAARAAFVCLRERQKPDGSWLGEYGSVLPIVDDEFVSREPAPTFHDTNFAAYAAVGVWHRLLIDGDLTAAQEDWPMVAAAMRFVLSLQGPEGDISWSTEALGTDMDDSLLAGNASIAKSLDCAMALGRALGGAPEEEARSWTDARRSLGEALKTKPERFDRSGRGARFAMDWYYPSLAGALDRVDARARLSAGAPRFVVPDRGCRCVSDEPWVTVAETAELAIALVAVGERATARRMLESQQRIADEDGAYWMGYQTEEEICWPSERPSWTQAAVILAADAIDGLSPAARALSAGPSEAAEHAKALHGVDFLEQA